MTKWNVMAVLLLAALALPSESKAEYGYAPIPFSFAPSYGSHGFGGGFGYPGSYGYGGWNRGNRFGGWGYGMSPWGSYRFRYRGAFRPGCGHALRHGRWGAWHRHCGGGSRAYRRFSLNLGIRFGGFSFGLRIRSVSF